MTKSDATRQVESAADEFAEAPLVSVVTASFNALAGLRRTVESVARQSMRDFEHIVVDGGSTDGSRAYLEGLGASVRWISEPDEGIADALNKGVGLARGTYVLVLQADDVFLNENSLKDVTPYLSGEADIVACDILFGEGPGARRLRTYFPALRLAFKPLHHQGVFASRALFTRIGGFEPSFRITMDYDFLLRANRAGCRIARCGVAVARMADGGISSRSDWQSLSRRFSEERRAQLSHCPGPAMRAVYAAYWPAYIAYRRIRSFVSPSQSPL
jgi:glycosyltransferase involved in cell wall biosynthesis